MSMIAYWTIRAAPAARARRRQRGDLGRAAAACCRSQVDPERMQPHDVSLDQVMEVTADALDAGLLQFSERGGHRHRRLRRHPQPAARRSGTSCRSSTPDDLAQVRRSRSATARPLRLGDVAERGRGPPAADRRRGHQRRARACMLIVEKFPWANTLDVTNGVEEALDELRPGLPAIDDRHDDLPAGDVHRDGHRQPQPGAAARLPARGAGARRVPVRVAHRR